jgi:hypothetical protein
MSYLMPVHAGKHGIVVIPMVNWRVTIIGLEELFNHWSTRKKSFSLLENNEVTRVTKR